MGYNEHQLGAYIVFIPEISKLVVSKDVIFDENIPQGPIDNHVNDYFKELLTLRKNTNRKDKTISDYEYLIGSVYFDPDKELQCRCVVTRIEQKGRNIIALYKRIIDNKVEDEEFDINSVHVAEIKKMLGVHLSEDDVEKLRIIKDKVEDEEFNTNSIHVTKIRRTVS